MTNDFTDDYPRCDFCGKTLFFLDGLYRCPEESSLGWHRETIERKGSPKTPDLAELRRLLDVNRGRYFHALPWHVWDRGIGYELHVGATCRDEMEPRGYCEEVNNGFRETFGAPEAELIVAAVNALPGLLDAAAERDALAAKVERVRELPAKHPAGGWYMTSMRDVLAALDEEPQP